MRLIGTLGLLLASFSAAIAQDAALPAGRWEGVIKMPNRDLNVVINFAQDEQKAWLGSLDIAVPNAPSGLPLSDIKVSGEQVTFRSGIGGGAAFTGKLNAEAKTLNGTVASPGGDIPFELKRTGEGKVIPPKQSTAISKDLEGKWEGTLEPPGQTLRLVLTFTGTDGKGGGNIVSLDQGSPEIPISYFSQDGDKVAFEVQNVGGKYAGVRNEAKTEIKGEWTQGGNTFPLILNRGK